MTGKAVSKKVWLSLFFLCGSVFVALKAALQNTLASNILGSWSGCEYLLWLLRAKDFLTALAGIMISWLTVLSIPMSGLHILPQGSPFVLVLLSLHLFLPGLYSPLFGVFFWINMAFKVTLFGTIDARLNSRIYADRFCFQPKPKHITPFFQHPSCSHMLVTWSHT